MFIRPMESADIVAVASLCEQFGYPATTEQVAQRFEKLSSDSNHAILVALNQENRIIGWLHVFGRWSISSDPASEIGGIVVDQACRRQGVGRALMEAAEKWALQNGIHTMRLRSGTSRPESHHFYPQVGYELLRSQHLYRKQLLQNTEEESGAK